MKTTLTILLTTLTVTITFGQITTTKVAPKTDQVDKTPYDSTKNFLEGNVYQYIGQELYLNAKSESLRKYGYSGFLLDYNNKNVYKCCQSYNSKYDELAGKYFKVLDVVTKSGTTVQFVNYGKDYDKEYFLKLERKDNGDIVYFHYDGYGFNFPFIVLGYWEKYKRNNVGKQFVLRYIKDELLDMKTGEKIEFINGSTWKCVDLTIEEQYYSLNLVFENDKGQKIMSGGNKGALYYWEKSVADNYKSKFGNYWQTILEGKVKIGMTNEMCELSWGKPKSINETITSGKKTEQWVYSDNYLYFDNGILTAIQ